MSASAFFSAFDSESRLFICNPQGTVPRRKIRVSQEHLLVNCTGDVRQHARRLHPLPSPNRHPPEQGCDSRTVGRGRKCGAEHGKKQKIRKLDRLEYFGGKGRQAAVAKAEKLGGEAVCRSTCRGIRSPPAGATSEQWELLCDGSVTMPCGVAEYRKRYR